MLLIGRYRISTKKGCDEIVILEFMVKYFKSSTHYWDPKQFYNFLKNDYFIYS